MSQLQFPLLPESAPFSSSQRAWLNGFFGGIFSRVVGGGAPGASSAQAPAAPVQEEEAFPWHDSAMPIDERMKLADGKKPERVLMAAMAQLDCGSCGYLCQTYAEAIARGEDKDLTKCTPGGKETSKKLKELVPLLVNGKQKESNASPIAATVPAARPTDGAWTRKNPFPARLLRVERLTGDTSEKDVRHVEFSLKGSSIHYKVGDALGVWPENDADLVVDLLCHLGAGGAEDVPSLDSELPTSAYEALLRDRVITTPTADLIELMQKSASNPDEAAALQAGLDNDSLQDLHVVDLLERFPSARLALDDFVGALAGMQPRLYSISSSPKVHTDEVHLTVGAVRYENSLGRKCKGVASTFMADRVRPGQKVRVFIHSSAHFTVPPHDDLPMIMVGPGTGIAPFRAFLEERLARGAKGKNWLFFGDQRSATDFLYRHQFESMKKSGLLTRLDTAFSRDQKQKIYVQQRMQENGREIWKWLLEGAYFFVCGDAKRMAKDVDEMLKQIIIDHGDKSPEQAAEYVNDMKKANRYQRDVY